jgi:formamidopyrimidine-DNA glycosylase
VTAFVARRGYGTDALEMSQEEFFTRLNKKKVAIKTALIDQHLVAGVGNEFADEILFRSRIHPNSLSSALSKQQFAVIHRQMEKILKEAVSVNADRRQLGHYFFLGNRVARLQCPNCGGETELKTIGGRSTYYCPNCQVLHR